MRLIKSVIIAFSMYSQIPMPQFEWKDTDMRYMLCFFPWVGALTGACVYLWRIFCENFGVGNLCYTILGVAMPLLITGGFHIDGFMDTMDAFHSYQPREKKLEILKDSHIGAFSVIMLAAYGLIYTGAFSEVQDRYLLQVVCAGFVFSRCLSGIAVVSFPTAKKEGMLCQFADKANRRMVKASLYLQGGLCIAFMLWRSLYGGIFIVLAALMAFGYYYRRCRKELGGITGDTAGYFILLSEGCMMAAAGVFNVLM